VRGGWGPGGNNVFSNETRNRGARFGGAEAREEGGGVAERKKVGKSLLHTPIYEGWNTSPPTYEN
jgi:hypothetical protein